MPDPDCVCKVINGKSGYIRDNGSWIIGRIMRDFDSWKDRRIESELQALLVQKHEDNIAAAEKASKGSGATVEKPKQAGLCVSVYKALPATPGKPASDLVYWSGFFTAVLQLGVAAIPCGIFGDWSIVLVTVVGIFLAFLTGSLPQWRREKWACREQSSKKVVLTKGNGSQHAIVIIGDGVGLDLEDLAAGATSEGASASYSTRILLIVLSMFWVLLLITAAGIKNNSWFLLAVGGIGILQNIFAAGWRRKPEAFGVPLKFHEVISRTKVMETLYAVEEKYPRVGRSMLNTYFPGGDLRPEEEAKWRTFRQ